MAEGSRDQASSSATELEDDSPNMIVYRKVSLTALEKRASPGSDPGTGSAGSQATPAHVRRNWERRETGPAESHCSRNKLPSPRVRLTTLLFVSEGKVDFGT